ncbi:uncharacterized protein LOC129905159 [Episyrphus balteatus]|uniref:uncharacterized protein LOC129905159 n=1 Tax=Episyrphus balteatus TaxID=286459 RepID=UPI002485FB3E|nr:uncharacterized protein LOC129905159 [Episyrphus balteatus]
MFPCFLCGEKHNARDFDKIKFEKCVLILKIRKSKNFKYSDISLPKEFSELGYHRKCFKKFTVIHQHDLKSSCSSRNLGSHDDEINFSTSCHSTLPTNEVEGASSPSSLALDVRNVCNDENTKCSVLKSQVKSRKPCIFCGKTYKKNSYYSATSICSSKDVIGATKQYAELVGDSDLIDRLRNCDSFLYHHSCKALLKNKYNKKIEKKISSTKWHALRLIHKEAFDSLTYFIEQNIFIENKIFYLQDLYLKYKSSLLEIDSSFTKSDFNYYLATNLQYKLLKKYGDNIVICSSSDQNKKKIVYKQGLDLHSFINIIQYYTLWPKNK